MWKGVRFSIISLMVLLMAACVSVAPKTAAPAEGGGSPVTKAAPSAALPSDTESPPQQARVDPVEVSIPGSRAFQQRAPGAAVLVDPVVPAFVRPPSADPGLVTPVSPRIKVAFVMALPEAPATPLPASAAQSTVAAAAPATAVPGSVSAVASAPAVVPGAATGAPVSPVKPATPAKPATQAAAAKPQAAPAAQGKASPARSQPRQTAAAPAATAAGASTAGSAADGSTASGSTAAVGQTIPTLPGTSGSAAGGTSPTAAGSPASYGRLREIYARQGDELQIGLDGMGFLFLGFPDRPGQADGMAFKSKENRSSKTWFTFQALKMGNYDLDFLQQNNTSGTTAKETVRVHVVSDQDFAAATAQQPDSTNASSSTAEPGDPWFAARLAGAGAYEAAIAELLKGYKDGNAPLNDQIAGLYMKMKTYDAAAKYYAKNLSPSNPSTPSAVLGLTRIAIVQKDQPGLLSRLKQFLAVDDPSAEETLIQAIRLEKDQSQIGVGLDLAAAYAQRYPGGKWLDEADFLTAQFLEADSQFRDIARARDIYQQLVTTYPESAFAEASRQRLLYINRHFFQVR